MAETYFIKEKKEKNYTVIDNTFIRDIRLSWKAKGLMTYLLSLPEDWEVYVDEIIKHSTDGEAGLRAAIKELIKYGYIEFERLRNEKGVFIKGLYRIIECPRLENPNVEKPRVENQALLNTNNTKGGEGTKTDVAKQETKKALLSRQYKDNSMDNVHTKKRANVQECTPENVYQFYITNKLPISPERFWRYNNKRKWKDKDGKPIKDWQRSYLEMCEGSLTLDEKFEPDLKFNKSNYDFYTGE